MSTSESFNAGPSFEFKTNDDNGDISNTKFFPVQGKEKWDWIEVHPFALATLPDGGTTILPLSTHSDELNLVGTHWNVYLHQPEGGIVCIAKLPTKHLSYSFAALVENVLNFNGQPHSYYLENLKLSRQQEIKKISNLEFFPTEVGINKWDYEWNNISVIEENYGDWEYRWNLYLSFADSRICVARLPTKELCDSMAELFINTINSKQAQKSKRTSEEQEERDLIVIEGNKLIASYMGWFTEDDWRFDPNGYYVENAKGTWYIFDERNQEIYPTYRNRLNDKLPFDKNWDELMAVVIDIRKNVINNPKYDFTLSTTEEHRDFAFQLVILNANLNKAILTATKEPVWIAIIEIIKLIKIWPERYLSWDRPPYYNSKFFKPQS